jgi:hypothetical protein
MPSRTVIQAIGAVVALVYLLSFIAQGAPVEQNWLAPFGAAVSTAWLLLVVFDRWAWRWPGICRLVSRPVVHGTWRGTLTSHWKDPATGERVATDPDVYLVVNQRFWGLSMRLLTKEGKSTSIVGEIDDQGDGSCAVVSIYRNTPKLGARERSPIHHGAVMLDIGGKPASRLEGFYWTDRKTMGELDLRHCSKKLIGDHSEGPSLP